MYLSVYKSFFTHKTSWLVLQIKLPVSSYPLYHSSYETFFAYDTFMDPGFSATNTITQFMAILAW